ncbi:MAG: PqqD family protein [Actinomycetes bacterium]
MTDGGLAAESIVLPRPDLVVEEFDDAVLVWDESGGKLHHLDLFGAIVWEELDGVRSLAQLASDLAADFATTGPAVIDDLLELTGRLRSEGLIDVVDLMQNDESPHAAIS